jgi:UDP-GlcNAc:undecaprenyl-phosphate GlcNAc-1-phosphate transferase
VAVFLGWLSGLAMSQFILLHRAAPGLPPHVVINFSIVAGACVIVLLGFVDDTKRGGVRPRVKIMGQVLAAVALLVSGVGTEWTRHFLVPLSVRLHGPGPDDFPQWLTLVTSSLGTVALVVFCCNATNLMDGLDGLCGGVTAIVSLGFVILAVYLAMNGGGSSINRDVLRIVLGLALLGGVMGFIPYNFNPASIFMGDTGSMFLGFSCAVMMILMADAGGKWFLAAGVMFALPVLDTALAFARRWVNRRPLFSPDKFHFHHQLVARGLTIRKAVLLAYGLAIAFMLLGCAIVVMRTRYALATYLVIFGYVIVAAYKIGMVHERPMVVADAKPFSTSDVVTAPERLDAGTVLEIPDEPPSGERPEIQVRPEINPA